MVETDNLRCVGNNNITKMKIHLKKLYLKVKELNNKTILLHQRILILENA